MEDVYGKQSSENLEEFNFHPAIFCHHLKMQLNSVEYWNKYLEMMIYSQLFVEFVDEQRKL